MDILQISPTNTLAAQPPHAKLNGLSVALFEVAISIYSMSRPNLELTLLEVIVQLLVICGCGL